VEVRKNVAMKIGKCRIVMNIDAIRFVFYQWARCCLIDYVEDHCLNSHANVFRVEFSSLRRSIIPKRK